MPSSWTTVPQNQLGVLRASGPDAVRFLQGQLSSDVAALGAARTQLAGFHNPQGRVIALLRLVPLGGDDLLALLPRELVAPVVARLGKYVLRAKVKLADDTAAWRITGLLGGDAPGSPPLILPAAPGELTRSGAQLVACVSGAPPRYLLVAPHTLPDPARCAAGESAAWQRLAIAAGEAQVYGATSEEFVAQMLNLDLLGAIAFDKGCYTGQEVIARAHYRGRVKRRLQRFVSAGPATLGPGAAGTFNDGRSFKVVDAVTRADGRCEFLAVTAVAAGEAGEAGAGPKALAAEPLPLPYALPD
jgi:hypothetical protein